MLKGASWILLAIVMVPVVLLVSFAVDFRSGSGSTWVVVYGSLFIAFCVWRVVKALK